jgi:hypothetical protein
LSGRWGNKDANLKASPGFSDPCVYDVPDEPLLHTIRSAVLLHLDPSKLGEPSFSEEITPRTEFDGSNLAASLADMAIQIPDHYRALIERLRTVVPSVKSVRFQKTSLENENFEAVQTKEETLFRIIKVKSIAYQAVFDSVSGDDIAAPYVSEGTLLTLGLLSVLCGPSRPRLVLIDELERGLHPKALGTLVAQIREVQKQFPDLQVVATTHSPYLVDCFKPEEVVLTAIGEDGSVRAACLNEHPDFEKWKNEMKPGEFWSTVGESWVLQSKPR